MPRYSSTRLVFLIMMVASVVIFETYAASYTSFLSVVKLSSPFRGLEELYTSTSHTLGSLSGGAWKSILLGVSKGN